MKQYQYNYSYLSRWMEANPQITNREIMQSFTGASNNNNSLALYEQRKTPMPIINLLRFCNTFGVPISAFIVEVDNGTMNDDGSIYGVEPSINDQLEPDGGYIAIGEKRPHGSRALRDPLEVEHIKSIVPGLVISKSDKREVRDNQGIQTGGIHQSATTSHAEIHQAAIIGAAPADTSMQHDQGGASPLPTPSATSNKKPDVSLSTLNKMLDIIAEQQKQMAEQQKIIAEQQREILSLTHRLLNSDNDRFQIGSISTAADPIHRDER